MYKRCVHIWARPFFCYISLSLKADRVHYDTQSSSPAIHIWGSLKAEGIADHYWPRPVFLLCFALVFGGFAIVGTSNGTNMSAGPLVGLSVGSDYSVPVHSALNTTPTKNNHPKPLDTYNHLPTPTQCTENHHHTRIVTRNLYTPTTTSLHQQSASKTASIKKKSHTTTKHPRPFPYTTAPPLHCLHRHYQGGEEDCQSKCKYWFYHCFYLFQTQEVQICFQINSYSSSSACSFHSNHHNNHHSNS